MEKINFQATYTKISIYASATSGARKAGAAGDAGDAGEKAGKAVGDSAEKSVDEKGGHGSAGTCQRNKDGDTFTLSIEAQSIQISGTLILDDSGKAVSASGRNAKETAKLLSGRIADDGKAAGDGKDAQGIGADYLKGLDLPSDIRLVNAFLDAMQKSRAEDGHGSHGRRHHFPELGDPQDVADRLIGQLGREHAEKGGSRAELADGVRRRLSDWEPSATKVAVEYREFRSEVHMKMTSGLDAWVASGAAPDKGGAA
jgi:hypothetical protein